MIRNDSVTSAIVFLRTARENLMKENIDVPKRNPEENLSF